MSGSIRMPRLPGGEPGRIVRWLVSEGQRVSSGEVIAEISTESATLELEALDDGTIERIVTPAGSSTVATGTPLAVIGPTSPLPQPVVSLAEDRGHSESPHETSGAAAAVSLLHVAAVPNCDAEAAITSHAASSCERSYREALRDALAEEMRRDARVILIGPDVRQNAGAPAVAQGLLDEFGDRRVVLTPVVAGAAAEVAFGAALAGARPVLSLASWASAPDVLDPLVRSASLIAGSNGGASRLPIVLRGPDGWAPDVPAGEARSLASWLATVPGLKVVVPTTVADAKGLLKSAIRDDGPVAVLECQSLYEDLGSVPDGADALVPIGKAHVVRPGRDVTLVSYGRALGSALDAAARLEAEGVSAEVLDLRTLAPLDIGMVAQSVSRTGRLVTVEDGWPRGAVGTGIVADLVCRARTTFRSPPAVLTGADGLVPYAPRLAAMALPDGARVSAAVLEMIRG